MIDTSRLRILVALSRLGTIAAVARAMSFSSSAVSQQLQQLAKDAGAPLLVRDGRRVALTPQAEILVAAALQILPKLEEAEAELEASLDQVAGVVRVAAFQTVAATLIPQMIARLRDTHPLLSIAFTQAEDQSSLPQLVAGQHDLVAVETYPDQPAVRPGGVDVEILGHDQLFVAIPASDSLAGRTWSLSDLSERAWVLEPEGSAQRGWAESVFRGAGFAPRVTCTSEDTFLHSTLVRSGVACALLPSLAVGPHPGFELGHIDPSRPVGRSIGLAIRASSAKRPGLDAVRRELRTAFSEQVVPIV